MNERKAINKKWANGGIIPNTKSTIVINPYVLCNMPEYKYNAIMIKINNILKDNENVS